MCFLPLNYHSIHAIVYNKVALARSANGLRLVASIQLLKWF
ncbi:hypothetical protein COO91_01991 [Nostoc flagelliforme CCNUN1]|uniref:Uncharacterized protein n=1 Tax=Nostoc flagelliforme CCNUN1 TaxID=2038116 RepID=A0A2K8SKX2_9NOSO|nr:hypothetical protein COO91_01991 [Nostoc flagelliforme CCNUN1]